MDSNTPFFSSTVDLMSMDRDNANDDSTKCREEFSSCFAPSPVKSDDEGDDDESFPSSILPSSMVLGTFLSSAK